ncbi:MAG: hypothetical protein AAB850_00165, partial [Patescibacteria group bacterium]
MTILNGGNVGIGTTTPNQKLSIFNSAADSAIEFSSLTGNPYKWTIGQDYSDAGKFKISSSTALGTSDRFVIDGSGNVGIGTTSPYARLSVVNTAAGLYDIFAISSSTTSGLVFKVDSYGNTTGDGAYTSPAADYAEYFYTKSVGLKSGEVVCVDILENNAVKRCERGADNNVMGIVSTKPSVIGNATKAAAADPSHYAVIGMLGQVEAYASAENGPIVVGDSLTSASSTPGVAMRADSGDSTVGIALEPLSVGTGKIKVLISRRNKSLAVAEVESLVVERIANMKIEDKTQQMVQQAVDTVMQANFTVSGSVSAVAFETANAPVSPFVFDTATTTAEIPAAVLTAAGSVDLYKLATYNLSGISALASTTSALAVRLGAQEVHLASLEARITALESGAISSASGSPVSLSSDILASALQDFGVFIQRGFAQFGTLIADQFVAATNSAGQSSAGTVTILAGNTVAQVENAYVKPSSKVFVTFTASATGAWYVSDKQNGSFKVVLEQAPTTDTSFDYFLVQTEGQLATSSPEVASGASDGPSGPDTIPPVITLLGDNPLHLSIGGEFIEPGVTVDDNSLVITYVNGIQQEASSAT